MLMALVMAFFVLWGGSGLFSRQIGSVGWSLRFCGFVNKNVFYSYKNDFR